MKEQFTRQEVVNIIEDVLMTWYNLETEFEERLAPKWLSNNNWDSEHLRYDWLRDFISNILP